MVATINSCLFQNSNYMFITITILDVIFRLVFNLKHDVLETGFCLLLQVEPTQFGPIDGGILCLPTPAITSIGFIKPTQNKSPLRVNISPP
jgi:hypothetical protein